MVEFATKDGVINSFGNIRVKSVDGGVAQLEQHLWRFDNGVETSHVRASSIDMRGDDTPGMIEDRLNSGRNYYINDGGVVRDLLASN